MRILETLLGGLAPAVCKTVAKYEQLRDVITSAMGDSHVPWSGYKDIHGILSEI